jgi:GrpB-like predicted nucleotidyltransferase (UPF0157 family)
MKTVKFFLPSQSYLEKIGVLYELHKQTILHALAGAKVEHIGATSVPGLFTKGDLDISVSVSEDNFSEAVVVLKSSYEIHQPENWTESFASFKVKESSSIPVGVQLVIQGSLDDIFIRSRDLLIAQPCKINELNQLKLSHDGGNMDKYVEEKGAFFTQLLQTNDLQESCFNQEAVFVNEKFWSRKFNPISFIEFEITTTSIRLFFSNPIKHYFISFKVMMNLVYVIYNIGLLQIPLLLSKFLSLPKLWLTCSKKQK